MNKVLVLLLIILIAPVIGGLYGIIHDQLTYTISPEYYTKFKFYQFGLAHEGNEAIFQTPRLQVSAVGFMATWWMGLPIGLVLGLVGWIHQDHQQMFRATIKALGITVVLALATGLIGLTFGYFYLAPSGVSWPLPDNLIDTDQFIAAGSMHNFSYLGGLIGLIGGVTYSVRKRRKEVIRP